MSARIRVAIAGASGATGSSIVNALLATPKNFGVTALARPASAGKDEYVELAKRGVIVKPVELAGPLDDLVSLLTGIDVVISCMTLMQLKEEITLITAASMAGVGRYVPSFFATFCPPRGVMMVREMKEDILDHIKRLYLPYTVIDVGWWYQLSLPPLPSGKIRIKVNYGTPQIIGDGNTPWAFTDNRDIGKYVAKIIADPKTLNKSVCCYSQVSTQNEVFDLLQDISGEAVPREYVTKEDLLKLISEGQATITKNNLGPMDMMVKLITAQYRYSLGIRGDNTPGHAKYLGYLDAKELYPGVEATTLKDYIQDACEGKVDTQNPSHYARNLTTTD